MARRSSTKLQVITSLDSIPPFASEDEEDRFWSTHTLSDELWDAPDDDADAELPPVRAERHQTVSIDLDEPTLRQVKILARRQRKPYKTVLRELIAGAVGAR